MGPHSDTFVQASVKGGRYTNASEVIRAGLRRLEEDEQKIAALRAAIEKGEASGYVEDFDAHMEALKAKRGDNVQDQTIPKSHFRFGWHLGLHR